MAAIIGADIEAVKRAAAETDGIVNLANWNSASQIVISGEKEAVEQAAEKIDAPKCVFLPVSAPFHSEMMMPAQKKLAIDLENTPFNDLQYPVINNIEAKEMRGGNEARQALIKQVTSPVLWHTTMLTLLREKQVERYCEVGSGAVLTGLLKRTARQMDIKIESINIQNLEDIAAIS
jgi:[acyl-carrier-protein] S-malonyltransferase